MALPPATTGSPHVPEKLVELLADAIAEGKHPLSVAGRLAKGNKAKERAIRRKLERLIGTDGRIAEKVVAKARLNQLVGLGPATRANSKQAGRVGRSGVVDRKLLFEATGFHNPRVSHEHSGDIKITIDMPRPKFVDATADED